MKNVTKYLERNSSTILAILGSVGVVCTTVLAINATPKALQLIEESNAETKMEILQVSLPVYVPTILMGLSTIGCVIGSNVISKRYQSSLISAYGLLDQSYKQYRKAAVDVYGTDADYHIRNRSAKNIYLQTGGYNSYDPESDIDAERILCFEEYSQRYFNTTMACVLNAQLLANRQFVLEGEISVNDYFDYLGLPELINGNEIGWACEFLYWLDFNNVLITLDDGLECCLISPQTRPDVINPHYFK